MTDKERFDFKKKNRINPKETSHINFLSKEIQYKNIEDLLLDTNIQQRIKEIQFFFKKNKIKSCSNLPMHFEKERNIKLIKFKILMNLIPTKVRSIEMNEELLQYCKQ